VVKLSILLAVLTPLYKRGAGFFVKTHHGVIRHVDEGRCPGVDVMIAIFNDF
jgi:hypothetical protein